MYKYFLITIMSITMVLAPVYAANCTSGAGAHQYSYTTKSDSCDISKEDVKRQSNR